MKRIIITTANRTIRCVVSDAQADRFMTDYMGGAGNSVVLNCCPPDCRTEDQARLFDNPDADTITKLHKKVLTKSWIHMIELEPLRRDGRTVTTVDEEDEEEDEESVDYEEEDDEFDEDSEDDDEEEMAAKPLTKAQKKKARKAEKAAASTKNPSTNMGTATGTSKQNQLNAKRPEDKSLEQGGKGMEETKPGSQPTGLLGSTGSTPATTPKTTT